MSNDEQPACPVDPQARDAWLRAAAAQSSTRSQQPPHPTSSSAATPSSSTPFSGTCDSSTIDAPHAARSPASAPFLRPKFTNARNPLSHDRQVSSIPRATLSAVPPDIGQQQAKAGNGGVQPSPNAQSSNPVTSETGNWVYPSESQFHAALVRKHGAGSAPTEETIPSIIPIHNAVNERTWHDILEWERQFQDRSIAPSSRRVGKEADAEVLGPQLVSFKGDSQKLTPRARVRGWLGYQHPFDRHDWIVRRRDGEEVEYVIDFYAGKGMGATGGRGTPLSFYLDVRPKLNSLEGARMRFWRFWGTPAGREDVPAST